jgi:hypothetical protein
MHRTLPILISDGSIDSVIQDVDGRVIDDDRLKERAATDLARGNHVPEARGLGAWRRRWPQSFRNHTELGCGMTDDQSSERCLTSWQRSMQSLAAWMARANRVFEPARPLVPTRDIEPARRDNPSRRPPPPRP